MRAVRLGHIEAVSKFPPSTYQWPNEAVVWQMANPEVLPDSGITTI